MTFKNILLLLFFAFTAQIVLAQSDSTATFQVAGNCGMCKKRIETAAQVHGVTSATWDISTKNLTLKFDPQKTSSLSVQQEIALVGHDTPNYKSPDEVYNKLHECCLYDRLSSEENTRNTKIMTTIISSRV